MMIFALKNVIAGTVAKIIGLIAKGFWNDTAVWNDADAWKDS